LRKFFEMAVTRLERKARRNKTKAKERTLAIKRNIRRNFVASPYKEESGVILEDDVLTVAKNLSKASKPAAKKATKAEAKEEAPAAAKKATKAETKEKAPTAAKKAADKLNKIEGIGPKIATVLNEAGVDSFATLATKSAEDIRAILDAAEGNFKAHDPGTWPKQAEMAAAGNWDELKAWQDELDGGK